VGQGVRKKFRTPHEWAAAKGKNHVRGEIEWAKVNTCKRMEGSNGRGQRFVTVHLEEQPGWGRYLGRMWR